MKIQETEKNYVVIAELPGADPDQIAIDLSADRLTISAEVGSQKQENGEGFVKQEYSYESVRRSFDLSHAPVDTEKAEADFHDGVLKITLPKKGIGVGPEVKKIPMNA